MLLTLLEKMDETLEALYDWAYRRLWLEVARTTAHSRPSTRPYLEALEDRLAPAAFAFNQGGDVLNPNAWNDTLNWLVGGLPPNRLPGLNDTVAIAAGDTCNLSGQSATVQSLTVGGILTVASSLTVAANGTGGSGSTTVAAGGTMTIGSSNPAVASELNTNSFTDRGTATVGGPSSPGGTASLNTTSALVATLAILNVGDTGGGTAGTMNVSQTMTVTGTVNVGGAGGSGGILGAYVYTSSGPTVVNQNGQLNIQSSGRLAGPTTVTGEIQGENGGVSSGAAITLGGTGSVSGGNGKLVAEINASFDITGTWTILAGNPPGSALNQGNFLIDGTLDADTSLTPDGDITLDPTGTLGGSGSLTIGKSMTWLGGTLDPAGGTVIYGELTVSGSGGKNLASNLLSDSPSVDLGGTGALALTNGADFTEAFGTVTLSLPMIVSYGGGTFTNVAGTLDVESPSATPTNILCDFINDQNLEVGSGYDLVLDNAVGGGLTMDLDGTLLLDGAVTVEGTVSSPTGLTMGPGGGTLYIGDSANYTDGTLSIPSGATDTLTSGTLEVTAYGTLTGDGTLNNSSGTVKLDVGSSTLGLDDYVQSPSGTLELQANIYMYSALAVSGSASLAGTLELDLLDGYTPPSGKVFTVLAAGSISGTFNVTPPDMTASYGSTAVTLTEN